MKKLLALHRSVRKYESRPVDEKLLHELLSAAIRCSTTGNMQLYSVVATSDVDVKRQLSSCHFNQPMIMEAPLVMTFCADFNRFNKWCRLRQAEPGYDNFHSFFTAAIDALLLAQNFCIAAESEGLGICYLGTTTYNAEEIVNVLNLPKFVIPVTTVTVGYPAQIPEQTDRLPIDAVLHRERYSDYSNKEIETYYRAKEMMPENKKFIAENNKQTLAQVFTDVRYKKSDNEYFTCQFINLLKKQGFQFDF